MQAEGGGISDDHDGDDAPKREAVGVQIKLLTRPDAETNRHLAELEIAAWGGPAGAGVAQRRVERLSTELATQDLDRKGVFAGLASGRVVGVGRVMRWNEAQTWMVFGVAVHPDYQRRGIGRALVRACSEFARERGATAVRSETHVRNLASVAFHVALGFHEDGRFVAEDGDHKIAYRMPVGTGGG